MVEKLNMIKSEIQIVWFKRDLRITDHAPIYQASLNKIPTLPIYIVEEEYWQKSFSNRRHWCFIYDSLVDLRKELKKFGQGLIVRVGDVLEIFKNLSRKYLIKSIFAHEETGNNWTFERDIAIQNWCFKNNIKLNEYPTNGVIRRLKNRSEWIKLKNFRMKERQVPLPQTLIPINDLKEGLIPKKDNSIFKNNFEGKVQRGGRIEALKIMESFLDNRGKSYVLNISKPETSEKHCSRISPHLTWGTISSREVLKSINKKKEKLSGVDKKYWNKNLAAMTARLSWRCHFIQKLETQPSIEFKCIHPFYEGLRENEFNNEFYHAWKSGQTGYPFIDACMRSLNFNGWITFRMRAMLVSFASYDLWLDWRKIGHHLAQNFTDYEPGIHYSQLQMQSGVTGVNSLRIYNPIKQSQDHDTNGEFIKKWVPELKALSKTWIHEPWKMDLSTQKKIKCVIGKDYPAPIVDHIKSIKEAKSKIEVVFKKDNYKKNSKLVLKKLVNKKIKKKSKAPTKQLELF